MKQLILLFAAVILFIVGVGYFTKDLQFPEPSDTDTKAEIVIRDVKVQVEVADGEAERKQGLSGRENLEENSGMLFVFPEPTESAAFWMKDMSFPIDIIWVDNGKVIRVDKNIMPEPGVPDERLLLYTPKAKVKYVLEVNAGFSDKNQIMVGDEAVVNY